eukprot:gnl/TRDRNA2_/TRDRNA2_197123_c0_seq1.p1 gnl/TRDRNA2_/TRDRNA2_197123_c0~~gnl/TRDRNA2_/TRDRNA2_197123_c0_seq1.p1  ORF type:complete len:317 (-),score=34.95 gnl/TRDRNA2_/TRDRNA2_197123_c0_seq1:73-1023(-)
MPFAALNGANLWYDDWADVGNSATEPLIFLHGLTGYRRNWGHEEGGAAWLLHHRFREPAPGTRYRCVFLEARGINASRDASGPYTLEQQALDIVALADFLQLGTFTFCGHSAGGGVGWVLATQHSERLRRLVQMAPVPSGGFPNSPDPGVPRTRTNVLQHYGFPKWKHAERDLCKERYIVLSEDRHSDTDEWFEDRARMVTDIPEEYWIENQRSLFGLRLSEAVAKCEIACLVIAGATDNLLQANVEDSKRMRYGVLHVLSKAGHEVAAHDPEGTALAIHDFMSGKCLSQRAYNELTQKRFSERGHTSEGLMRSRF